MTQGDGPTRKRDFEAEAREWDRKYQEEPHELPPAYKQLFALEYRTPFAVFFIGLVAVAGFVSGSPVAMAGSALMLWGAVHLVRAQRRKQREPYYSMTWSGAKANAIVVFRGTGLVLAGFVLLFLGLSVLGWSFWFGDL